MSRAGYALLLVAIVGAWLAKLILQPVDIADFPPLVLIGVPFAAVAGLLLLSVHAGVRLARGEVRLRPLDAAKHAVMMFGFVVACRFLAGLIFPKIAGDITLTIVSALAIAIVFGLSTTAYRRPV